MQAITQRGRSSGYLFGVGCGYPIAYPAGAPPDPDSVDPAAGIDREALLPEIRSRSTGSRPKTNSGSTRRQSLHREAEIDRPRIFANAPGSANGWLSASLVLLAAALAVAGTARATSSYAQERPSAAQLRIEAEIAGTRIQSSGETLVKVVGAEPIRIVLRTTNTGRTEQELSGLRFEGKVMGVPVFRCDVIAPHLVPPAQTVERAFEIEPACLKDQATGLIPASLLVFGPGREPLARFALVLDVKGSLKTIYGLTGTFVVAITLIALAALLAALVRQRLPRNRFQRALRFATVGAGIGLSLVFILAAAAVLVPNAENWIPVVAVPTVLLTVGGYLTPTPQREAVVASQVALSDTSEPTAVMPTAPSPTAPTLRADAATSHIGDESLASPTAETITNESDRPSMPTRKVRPVSHSGPSEIFPESRDEEPGGPNRSPRGRPAGGQSSNGGTGLE